MPQITRKIEFDAGHRVLRHESKCKHLHGHRYVAEITVGSFELDDLGRVMDFGVVKEKVGKWIDDHWDHNIILHPEDPLIILLENSSKDICDEVIGGKDPYIMPPTMNPTAENMAHVLFDVCRKLIDSPLSVLQVRLYETPNCWADHRA